MKFLSRLKISTKVLLGFGLILGLLLTIAVVGSVSLFNADSNFKNYRSLARQTNAEGRVQANMLLTRLYAKNFAINATEENINGVKERAQKTIELIAEARELSKSRTFRLMVDDLDSELVEYVNHFDEVTKKQKQRDILVHDQLNVIGPQMEQGLTKIMESAFQDGDADAAYRTGITMRSLLLARLYAARFLVQNDNASYERVRDEFRTMEARLDQLLENLENPKRREIAVAVRKDQSSYFEAFSDVHSVILARNNIMQNQLDRIGPKVAEKVEKLKLALKTEQDDLGPRAEASIDQAVIITVSTSIVSLLLGLIAVWSLGFGVSKPVLKMARAMKEISGGNTNVEVPYSDRSDEIGDMSRAVLIFKESMTKAQAAAEQERESAIEIGKSRDIAENATKAKASFLAAMSHEIRTPMNGIVGIIDLLLETKLNAEQRQMMVTVRGSGLSLLQIINDILDFSKIEAGKLKVESVPVFILDVVESVADTLAQNARNKDLNLSLFVAPNLPAWVMSDQVRLRQILFNLLGNAIKFTETTDSHRGLVSFHAALDGEIKDGIAMVKFVISDNGIGMSDNMMKNMFQPFTQEEVSTTRRFGGTGLGLSICKSITDAMGGKIDVKSSEGFGSKFTVSMPLMVDETNNQQQYEPSLEGLNFLLISSDDLFYEAIPSYIESRNGSCESIRELFSAEAAVVQAAEQGNPFDVIVFGAEYERGMVEAIVSGFRKNDSTQKLRYVLNTMDHKVKKGMTPPDMFVVDAYPIKRSAFLRALGVVCGRDSPDFSETDENLSLVLASVPTPDEAASQGQLILVAEDNPTNQYVINLQLKSLGYASEIFRDGAQGLEAWKTGRYGLVLTDCHMPKVDGYQMTAAIREMEKVAGGQSHIPIIAITANALQGEAEHCLSVGMDDYLTKPLEKAMLKRALAKWLSVTDHGDAEKSIDEADDIVLEAEHEAEHEAEEKPAVLSATIDLSYLRENLGDDDELINNILKKFADHTHEIMGQIDAAYAVRNHEALTAEAHKLKSSLRSIGAHAFADLCDDLESSGKDKDWAKVEAIYPRLAGFWDDVIAQIENI
jgi:signal transduction histidine kinase/CheY-like chemotaxis protein/HPt (histidine-containing phosphotransfer) domain-containing protein